MAAPETRIDTLGVLEIHQSHVLPLPLAKAAAAALTDVLCLPAADVGHQLHK